jgi:hypothetical protein
MVKTVEFKMNRTVRAKVVVSGSGAKIKFPSQNLGTIAIQLDEKIIRLYEVNIKKGEQIEIVKLK